jgi:hypothetical protein
MSRAEGDIYRIAYLRHIAVEYGYSKVRGVVRIRRSELGVANVEQIGRRYDNPETHSHCFSCHWVSSPLVFRNEPTLHGNSCLEPERSDTPAGGHATGMVWWYLPYTLFVHFRGVNVSHAQ